MQWNSSTAAIPKSWNRGMNNEISLNESKSKLETFIESKLCATKMCYVDRLLDVHSYRPQRSGGKVIFSQASVILSTAGCLPQCMLGYTPPGETAHTPQEAHPPSEAPPKVTAADGTHPN